MLINLSTLKDKQYRGLLSSTSDKENDCCLLSVKDSSLYFSSEKIIVKIKIDINDIADNEKDKVLTIPKTDLLHLMDYCSELTINNKNKYTTNTNISGVFATNEAYKYSYDSYSQIFNDLSSYEDYFEISNEEELKKILVASRFTYDRDRNPQAWFIYLEKDTVFSSSLYRIYTNEYKMNTDVQVNILQSLLPIVSCYPFPIKIKKMNKSLAIISDNVQVICSNIEKVSPVGIFESNFISLKEKLFSIPSVLFNVKELVDKLEYLKWYAKNNKNFKTNLTISEQKAIFSVKENVCSIELSLPVINIINFDFNLESVLSALKERSNINEVVEWYVLNDLNLYCIKLGNEEYFYSSKIVE